MSRVVLSLLGPFQALLDEQPLTGFRSDKSRALLAYLAAGSPRPYARRALAALLWPDCAEAVALTYLRGALANLRRLLGDDTASSRPPFLLVSRTTVQWNPGAAFRLDTAAFDALVPLNGASANTETQGALEEAVLLYRGAFMEGFTLDDSPAFEEWLLLNREHFGRRALTALRRLGALAITHGHYAAAAEYAHHQLALESWDEGAHCQLMTALALSGQRSAALAQYAVCRALLAQELGAEPAPETTELYLRIRANRVSASPALSTATAPPRLLPNPSPFVARARELARLDRALDRAISGSTNGGGEISGGEISGGCRVIFVRGDAGSGKTALLYAFAQRAVRRCPPLIAADGKCSSYGESSETLLPFQAIVQQILEAPVAWKPSPPCPGSLQETAAFLRDFARRRPLLLLLDDLQWADSGTLALLFQLGRDPQCSRILIAAAYRPEDVAQHDGSPRHALPTILNELQREGGEAPVDLDRVEGRAFVDALLDAEPNCLGGGFRAALHRHTEGHALFTVELLRAMKEHGALVRNGRGEWVEGSAPAWEELPPRVEAVIAERIERLPLPLRGLLQAASVQGETFSLEVLARSLPAGSELGEAAEGRLAWLLGEQLGRRHGLLHADLRPAFEPPGPPLLRYRFTHALHQTYLYGSLDAAQRAWLHRQVGAALEAIYSPAALSNAELAALLAWHHAQARPACLQYSPTTGAPTT